MLLLPLFFSCRPLHYSERRAQLDSLQRANQADAVFRNDSLQRILADYFDAHGTANDRMLAHYLLGRAYYDMGETPLALHHYHEAIENADTTDKDCDFMQLGRIHGQTAWLLLDQGSPSDALYELRDAVHYAKSSGDTLMCIACIEETGSVYGYLGLKDSAVTYRQIASSMYEKAGYEAKSAIALGPIIDILIEQGKLSDARLAMNRYETQSRIFNSHGDIEEGREMYYNAKGLYYLAIHQVDSAGLYFSKLKRTATYIDQLKCACSGLSRVFELKGNKDSALYYCQLANAYNDSSSNLKMTEGYQQAQARYRYNRHLQIARQAQLESMKQKGRIGILSSIIVSFLLISVLIGILLYRRQAEIKKREESLVKEYKNVIQERDNLERHLLELRAETNQIRDVEREISGLIFEKQAMFENLLMQYADRERELQGKMSVMQQKVKQLEEKLKKHRQGELHMNQLRESQLLSDAPIVMRFRKLGKRIDTHPSEKDWSLLQSSLQSRIPGFMLFINKPELPLNQTELRICVLLRIGFSLQEIRTLLDLSPANVTTIRERMSKKLFGARLGAQEFDRRLREIQ